MSWSIWITDPPGGGRPIVAEAAAEILREGGMRVRLLQLDEFRMSLASDPDGLEPELVDRALAHLGWQVRLGRSTRSYHEAPIAKAGFCRRA